MAKRLYICSVLFGIADWELAVEELLTELASSEDGDGETLKWAPDDKSKQYSGSSDVSVGDGGTIVGLCGDVQSRFWRRGDAKSAQVDSADTYNIWEGADKIVARIATVGNKYNDE